MYLECGEKNPHMLTVKADTKCGAWVDEKAYVSAAFMHIPCCWRTVDGGRRVQLIFSRRRCDDYEAKGEGGGWSDRGEWKRF